MTGLYAAASLAAFLFSAQLALRLNRWRYELRRKRRRRRRGGDITAALARQVRFYDDQPDPRELTRW